MTEDVVEPEGVPKTPRQEYYDHVDEVALGILDELEAGEWILDNQDDRFTAYKFIDEKEYNGEIHSYLDASCGMSHQEDYEPALGILTASDQDAEDVDPGVTEECKWQQILVSLAFYVFERDVHERLEYYFTEGNMPDKVGPFQSSPTQRAYFPTMPCIRIPRGPHLLVQNGVVRIQSPDMDHFDRKKLNLELAFEGDQDEDLVEDVIYVTCKRIYSLLETDVDADIERSMREYGVEEEWDA